MSGSEPTRESLITAGDYLLYRRCPRSLHRKLSGEKLPSFSPADECYPVVPERDRIREIARLRFPHGRPADSGARRSGRELGGEAGVPGDTGHIVGDEALSAAAAQAGASSPDPTQETIFDARCRTGPFIATADIAHPQKPQGFAAVIVREGTSIKESYLREAAFLDYCFTRCEASPERVFIHHVNKSYQRHGPLDPHALLVERDVTRRVRKLGPQIEEELEKLESELQADPLLSAYRDTLCARPATCPLCSSDLPDVDVTHVSTLHRGGPLVADLLREGITSIADVPRERLVHPRQEIQQRAVVEGEPQVDRTALSDFLARLAFPVFYLDFEATSSALPPFDGVHPWEHVPYLYSLHREDEEGAVTHHTWMMEPGTDGRREMAERLVEDCGHTGSIVVYSAGFERGILTRLAGHVPDLGDALTALTERIVDLLEPFHEFVFYHHDQRGKVSLKTVLPVLTEHDYSAERIQDGYTANLVYRYLSEQTRDLPLEADALLANLVSYCAMDTIAMVHIVRELRVVARA